jgi:hypothetical protein
MLPLSILNQQVTVTRRTSQGRDSLNNPIYGSPTNGDGWNIVYTCVPARLAFSTKKIQFAPEGERISPVGIVYYNAGWDIKAEDRILVNGIEYTVISVVEGIAFGNVVDHYEAIVQLP